MIDKNYSTDYAPAERATEQQVQREVDLLREMPLLGELLDSMPDIVLILNEQRQIAFANQALANAFNIADKQAIYGLRPGEALDCIHSNETICGCGTTSFCRTCGAVNAILSGLRGNKQIEECRITQKNSGNAFDLRVTATPFKTGEHNFVIFVVTDISHEKRRKILERAFFHDISNTLSSVVGCAELLPLSPSSDKEKLIKQLSISVYRLMEEINSQRGLIAAESGDLSVNPNPIRSLEFLREVLTIYSNYPPSCSTQIHLDDAVMDIMFVSDKTLLSRVIGNMLKNALEASPEGDRVLAGCNLTRDRHICFWVQNFQFMPTDIQLQVFNRSFSTKGMGRGVGTYSMKLLCEHYLKGKVSFTTSSEQGTIFTVTLPLTLD